MAALPDVLIPYVQDFDTFFKAHAAPRRASTPHSIQDPIDHTLQHGGKRIRPLLTLLGAECCGGTRQDALPAATCIEMTHNFTLIHDDVMDDADIRRGQESVYKKWGTNRAILSGDSLFAQAMIILTDHYDSLSRNRFYDLYKIYLESIYQVCNGQALDMDQASDQLSTPADYLHMIDGKTAALLRGSLQMGGIVAGGDSTQLDHLSALGTDIGIAFQIQDDLLDITGTQEKVGKSIGGDIIEGKQTFLMTTLSERMQPSDKEQLQHLLGKSKRDASDVDWVIKQMEMYGVIDEAKKKLDQYYQQGMTHLDHFAGSKAYDVFSTLIHYLMGREG
ncbi:MAG: polyprenyl synthetase family protein [Balneolaceae bacterium]|nr:polyprenyl synthetase family protein [Balneolaceae bacterium]